MRKADPYFLRAVRDYDPMLHVRWCEEAQEFSVEREAHATEHATMAQLRKILHSRANRPIADELPVEKLRFMLKRRLRARVELSAALKHRRHLFLVPDTTTFFLRCVLMTLHEQDSWNHPEIAGNGGFDPGHIDKMASRISRGDEWDEIYDDRRKEARRSDDNRNRAKEAYQDIKFLDGETSGAPIRHRRMLNSQTWRP